MPTACDAGRLRSITREVRRFRHPGSARGRQDAEHHLRHHTDPQRLARWWAETLGGHVEAVAAPHFVTVAGIDGPRLAFQLVDDPTPGKNRIHIDFHTADMEGEVRRLVGLGAREVGRAGFGEFAWAVPADPDGNASCVPAEPDRGWVSRVAARAAAPGGAPI
jgi:hypothetical protein